MKVLQCIPTLEGGGAERQLCYLAKGLTATGHDVHVVCMRGGVNETRLRSAGATVDILSDLSPSSPVTFWRLLQTIRRFQPHVVQTWICQMDVWGGIAARWAERPWILSERCSGTMYPVTLKNRSRLRVARKVSLVVANSHAGEEYWRQQFKATPLRSRVIRNALPLAEIDAIRADRPESIGTKDRIILFAGRLDAQKNLGVFFRSLPVVLKGEAVQVLVCGEGPDAGELKQLASDLGIANRVRFLGYVGNLYALMKAADVFVSVSKFEGQPNAVMEAMACRCPLVVSNIPEHREFLDLRSAFIASVDSVDSVADQILACLRSADVAREQAANARTIAERWDLGTNADRYLEAYQSILHDVY